MRETGLLPDFVVIDGGEGGTGAGPIELTDHGGMPLREGLAFAHGALVGAGLRERVKVGAAGKLIDGFDIAVALALGADWANNARGFMFALGCIQAQRCHTNQCPVGITTHDRWLQRGLVVPEKAERVRRFHHETVNALAGIAAAAGLESAHDFRLEHFTRRFGPADVRTLDAVHPSVEPGALLEGRAPVGLQALWARADARAFGGEA
jgi:glutamate synthase domain-containing protein 2